MPANDAAPATLRYQKLIGSTLRPARSLSSHCGGKRAAKQAWARELTASQSWSLE
jgi:hypothetical protein